MGSLGLAHQERLFRHLSFKTSLGSRDKVGEPAQPRGSQADCLGGLPSGPGAIKEEQAEREEKVERSTIEKPV